MFVDNRWVVQEARKEKGERRWDPSGHYRGPGRIGGKKTNRQGEGLYNGDTGRTIDSSSDETGKILRLSFNQCRRGGGTRKEKEGVRPRGGEEGLGLRKWEQGRGSLQARAKRGLEGRKSKGGGVIRTMKFLTKKGEGGKREGGEGGIRRLGKEASIFR